MRARTDPSSRSSSSQISMLQIIAQVTALEDRPRIFGLFGAVFGLSSVVGPLVRPASSLVFLFASDLELTLDPSQIGGALTDHSTWRWCFLVRPSSPYSCPRAVLTSSFSQINLPVGAVTIAGCVFLLKSTLPLGADPNDRTTRGILRQTLRIDWLGAVLCLGAVTCLVLALQWGGNQRPWNDGGVIAVRPSFFLDADEERALTLPRARSASSSPASSPSSSSCGSATSATVPWCPARSSRTSASTPSASRRS